MIHLKGDKIQDGDDLVSAILPKLHHTVEDNSFDYEFGSARGTHHEYSVELDECRAEVTFPPDTEMVPITMRGTYRGGGCDGEHRGRCKPCCTEVEIDFHVHLDGWHLGEDGCIVVSYDIDQI